MKTVSDINTPGTVITIDKAVIHEMPLVIFQGRIIVIETAADVLPAVAYLSKQPAIGFDTETRPTFHKGEHHPVALVQLSTEDTCFLFRINKTGFTEPLIRLLENKDVVKVGLSTKDDFHGLNQLAPVEQKGVVELQSYISQWGIADKSLQKVYAIVKGGHISKGQRLTNWEAATLSPSQQQYAAIDAWACLEIYNALNKGSFNPSSSPYKSSIK